MNLRHITTIACLVFALACTPEATSPLTTAPAQPIATVRVGYVSTGLTGVVTRVIKDNDLPAKHQLRFEYIGFPNPTVANQAFVLGKFDVNLAASANVVALAREEHYDIVYLHPTLLNSVSTIVRTDTRYRTLRDLRGKKIGWYGRTSGGGTGFLLLAALDGLDEKDFRFVDSSPPALWPLLAKKQVDAIVIYEPFVARMLATKQFRTIGEPFSQQWKARTGHPMEMAGIAAHTTWLNRNPTMAAPLIAVWHDAAKYMKENTQAVLAKYPDLTEIRSDEELALAAKGIQPVVVSEWDHLDVAITDALDRLAKMGVFTPAATKKVIHRVDTEAK